MKKLVPDDAVLIPEQAKRVFEGVIYDVYQWPQQMFDGSTETFEMLRRADTVSAICITDDGILVLDDEQPHSGSRKSFPSGRVDPADQSVLAAAQREVREETGYTFNKWKLVKVRQPHTKIEWFIYYFVAWDVGAKGNVSLDVGEEIAVHTLSFEEVKQLVINKTGYLGESTSIFENLANLRQLMDLPECTGKMIER